MVVFYIFMNHVTIVLLGTPYDQVQKPQLKGLNFSIHEGALLIHSSAPVCLIIA